MGSLFKFLFEKRNDVETETFEAIRLVWSKGSLVRKEGGNEGGMANRVCIVLDAIGLLIKGIGCCGEWLAGRRSLSSSFNARGKRRVEGEMFERGGCLRELLQSYCCC